MPQPANKTSVETPASRPIRTWLGRLLLLFLLVLLGVTWWQRQAIADWIRLYDYTPPATITQLAQQTTMTDRAKHLFYINKPIIADKSQFSGYCKQQEQAIVLGCYHSDEDGIFLLRIDPRSQLHGVMQVTAAHEMLHAAYDRLSPSQRAKVDRELEDFYAHGLQDKSVKAEIDSYKKTEPHSVVNEMHSIFGTEVAHLPADLEQYYTEYFTNRQAVVAQARQYQQAFRSREQAVDRYDKQLARLKQQIEQHQTELLQQAASLKQRNQQMRAMRQRGDIAGYNAAVPGYNQAVDAFNSLLATAKQEIVQYNKIVKQRNALVVEEQQLAQQLSGSDLPAAK